MKTSSTSLCDADEASSLRDQLIAAVCDDTNVSIDGTACEVTFAPCGGPYGRVRVPGLGTFNVYFWAERTEVRRVR